MTISTEGFTLSSGADLPRGVEIVGALSPEVDEILTPDALAFLAGLARRFEGRRQELLQRRAQVQADIDEGRMPDFLEETRDLRTALWQIAPVPSDLMDRRVEITGPTDRKMLINALNSGASAFMADFEDANSPTWENMIAGQANLRAAVRRTIAFTSAEGKRYRLNDRTAVLLVRPRGWHLQEKHVRIDGAPISASIFDFGLYLFHNGHELLHRGTGPYLYLPKLEHYLEARLWNDVFLTAQAELGIPPGTIKATVLIETILAAFQMHEILWELRGHSSGLNCGRWDYIFSVIKKFRNRPGYLLPDRARITMTAHMMRSYSLLTIRTCHKRGAHAIGGMSAYIPVKTDPAANDQAIAQVMEDKRREVCDGHDGTWVAHPGLVPVARDVFDAHMPQLNQIDHLRGDVQVSSADLLTPPKGSITEAGLRQNVSVGLQYLSSWLAGQGAVAVNNLMEDVATAEISRAQIWQWTHRGGTLEDGRPVTQQLVRRVLAEEVEGLREQRSSPGVPDRLDLAAHLLDEVGIADRWNDFLTLVGYNYLDVADQCLG